MTTCLLKAPELEAGIRCGKWWRQREAMQKRTSINTPTPDSHPGDVPPR